MAGRSGAGATEELDELERDVLRCLALAHCPDRPHVLRAHKAPTPPPDPLVSLAEYHRWRMARVAGQGMGRRLQALAEATHDLEIARRPPAYTDPDGNQSALERDHAVLRWEGKRPEWVAVFERCSFAHVRSLRARHGLHPLTGLPPDWDAA